MSVSRLEIAEKLYNKGENPTISPLSPDYRIEVENLLIEKFAGETDLSKAKALAFKCTATNFAAKVRLFYKENGRVAEKMFEKKKTWFEVIVKNPLENVQPEPGRPKGTKKNKGGAPKKNYKDNGKTQKLEKAQATKSDHSLEELLKATLLKAKEDGNKDCAWALDYLLNNPISGGSQFRQLIQNPVETVIPFSPEECLALIIELRLTQR